MRAHGRRDLRKTVTRQVHETPAGLQFKEVDELRSPRRLAGAGEVPPPDDSVNCTRLAAVGAARERNFGTRIVAESGRRIGAFQESGPGVIRHREVDGSTGGLRIIPGSSAGSLTATRITRPKPSWRVSPMQMTSPLLGLVLLLCAIAAPAAAGEAAAGAAKSAVCGACHGATGNSTNPEWPNLAGQHESYIAAQLALFKQGVRDNILMMPNASALSDQDMLDLGAHFEQQT